MKKFLDVRHVSVKWLGTCMVLSGAVLFSSTPSEAGGRVLSLVEEGLTSVRAKLPSQQFQPSFSQFSRGIHTSIKPSPFISPSFKPTQPSSLHNKVVQRSNFHHGRSFSSVASSLESKEVSQTTSFSIPRTSSVGKVPVIVEKIGEVLSTKSSMPLGIEGKEAKFDTSLIVSGFMASAHELTALRSYTVKEESSDVLLPEAVIGTDDRILVTNTTSWPWRVQGKLMMTFPNGKNYMGSGTLINKHHVLTAGHCVFDKSLGGWATSITFTPAQNNVSYPYGTAVATRLVSVKGWTDNQNGDWDMGALILDRNIGDQAGWFGIITGGDDILRNYYVNISGYPSDIPTDGRRGRLMYTMKDAIKRVSQEVLGYHIDTYGGQSGSGVWSLWSGHEGYKCAGIHVRGSSTENQATRISRVKFDRIVEWMNTW